MFRAGRGRRGFERLDHVHDDRLVLGHCLSGMTPLRPKQLQAGGNRVLNDRFRSGAGGAVREYRIRTPRPALLSSVSDLKSRPLGCCSLSVLSSTRHAADLGRRQRLTSLT